MSSSDCVVANFKTQTEDSMLVIEWEKHEGHRLLQYFKHPSKESYDYPASKTNYGKNASEVFPAFRRRCIKSDESFVEASARLMAGSFMRKEGDKYVRKDDQGPCVERSIKLEKVEGRFDLSLIEEVRKGVIGPVESTKVVEAEIFTDLRKALSKMGKLLKQDDEESEIEHQAYSAYLKEMYPPEKLGRS